MRPLARAKGWPTTSTVSTCKAAVVHLARILSAELVDRGIRVNTLSPGPTDTAMFGRFPGEEQGEAVTTPLLPLPPHLHLDAARRGGEASLRLSPDGTSLEMIEKHYGDARVDADQLDEMIGEFESATGNLPGTLPDASDDSLPSKVKEPFVFYRGSNESGRPGSNRRRPAWEAFLALAGQGFFGGGSRNGITQYDEGRRAAYGAHATTTRPLGAALPVRGSSVTSSPSGSAASAGASAMRRVLPPASGSTVPSEVHVAPCRTHTW